MIDRLNRLHLTAAALVLGLGAAGFATADGAPDTSANGETLRCEIVEKPAHGMTSLEGVLHSETAITGSYSFRVVSNGGGNSSNITQGGEFSAAPGAPATLGTVMLGNASGTYSATLEVTANGKTACTERTGSAT
jgi:hypothetical protein